MRNWLEDTKQKGKKAMKKMTKATRLIKMKTALCLLATASMVGVPVESKADESAEHEPITIIDFNRDYTALMELVHETYPEINLQIEPYKGRNTSAYMKKQLVTGIIPDIYTSTQEWDAELLQENLADLSKYAVTDMYNQVRLNEFDVDGAIYLLPYDYSINGIGYNKTLFEKNNIEVPTSFAQLRDETIPALEEAGIEISDCLMNLPRSSFQYFFGIASTGFVNTLGGRAWQRQFVKGEEQASEALQSSVDYFQQWIDCGMMNMNRGSEENGDLMAHFMEGNTAFWIGAIQRFSQNEDGTGDQYGLLPYLSEDGSQNVYITQNMRCYGLNKELEEPGNEQKLEDALHVLEVMSTLDGYSAVLGDVLSSMCSIKEFKVSEDSPYAKAVEEINNGHSAPILYTGWEDYLVPFGEAVRSWITGDMTGEEAVAVLDEMQEQEMSKGTTYYGTVTEMLDTVQAAQLSGQIFMEAADCDAALISYNIYQPEVLSNLEDGYGANGKILPGEVSEEDITIFLPTGWYDTLQTAVLSGAKIKQMAEEGCDLRDNGYPYPYVFLTKDGQPLDDDTDYTVVICGTPKAERDSLGLVDTGIVGLDAAKEYFLRMGEISSAVLDDSLVQNAE